MSDIPSITGLANQTHSTSPSADEKRLVTREQVQARIERTRTVAEALCSRGMLAKADDVHSAAIALEVLWSELDASQARLAQAEWDIARLEGRACLICGAPDTANCPEYQKGDGMTPCTFDPRPIDAARSFLQRATAAEERTSALAAALTRIASARQFVNGMGIDPYSERLCKARDTAEVAREALKGKP